MRIKKWLVVAMTVSIASLAGCATTSTGGGAGSHAISQTAFEEDVDFQRMAIITEDALSRGYKIVWVHPPQKKKGPSRD